MPRALLVEDSPTNQLLAQLLLQEAGYEVTIVNNGEDSVTAVAEGTFDLVLMDVLLPGIDGCEATRQIRAQQQTAETAVPILAMTGELGPQDYTRCLESGMDACLEKPLDLEQLDAALVSIRDRRNSAE
jgi:CheY-like chemotaxis protein